MNDRRWNGGAGTKEGAPVMGGDKRWVPPFPLYPCCSQSCSSCCSYVTRACLLHQRQQAAAGKQSGPRGPGAPQPLPHSPSLVLNLGIKAEAPQTGLGPSVSLGNLSICHRTLRCSGGRGGRGRAPAPHLMAQHEPWVYVQGEICVQPRSPNCPCHRWVN